MKCSFQVVRNILGTEPRVTRFKINWDDSEPQQTEEQQQTQGQQQQAQSSQLQTTTVGFSENSCSQNAMEVM